jgi:hypothetical protein
VEEEEVREGQRAVGVARKEGRRWKRWRRRKQWTRA